jgi:hypothetical protein
VLNCYRWVVVALLLLVCLPLAAESLDDRDAALALTGIVEITTAPQGTATVVTVDVQSELTLPDGRVEHAFRLQHERLPPLSYRGPARIAFKNGRLLVAIDGQPGLVFELVGHQIAPLDAGSSYIYYPVYGLAHFWGYAAPKAALELTDLLLDNGCSLDSTSPDCDFCFTGGRGESDCTVSCGGDGDCSIGCAARHHACCNCPGSCRCCPDEPGLR